MSEARASARPLALITGASVGLGRDFATIFAANGYDLIVTARNQQQLESVATDLRAKYGVAVEVLPKDLSRPEATQEIFDHLQSSARLLDVLVNNAGFGTNGPFIDTDVVSQAAMLQVNVVALTQLTRLFLPAMVKRHSGRVMNVASVAAFLPGPLMAVYYASKAYVLSFSEAIASELAGTGVTVTAFCPGATQTEFFTRASMGASPLVRANMMDSMTVARIGYRAMQQGKRVAIAGFQNRLMAGAVHFTPRRLVTAISKKLNQSRQ